MDHPVSTPLLVCLHGLGCSARSFDAVAAALAEHATHDAPEVLALDLPGSGGEPAVPGTSVAALATSVGTRVARHLAGRDDDRWVLVGHSMGGKVATVLASGAVEVAGLPRPLGTVLLAGSPPSPEPVDEERRAAMLSWVADGDGLDRAQAREFLDGNTDGQLPPALDEAAVADLLRAAPAAWRDWLEHGTREDWAERVGVVDLPALLVAGAADGDLGADAQRELNGPVHPRARFLVLDGAAHLLPLERPAEVAAAVAEFCRGLPTAS